MPTILRLIDARNIDSPSAKIQYIPPDTPAVNGTGLRPISLAALRLMASPIGAQSTM
jgi:hypothetical protein